MFRVEPVSPHHPDVIPLVAELDRYQIGLYGVECCHLDSLDELSKDNVVMLAAFEGTQLLGIGAVKQFSDYAELKRIIVVGRERQRGVGKAIVIGLERIAQDRGRMLMRLETGAQQAAAIKLYETLGYTRCGPFGCYQSNHVSVFFEKQLRISS